jgi:GTPase SAR1 family protein
MSLLIEPSKEFSAIIKENIIIYILGDSKVGKTTMIKSLKAKKFIEEVNEKDKKENYTELCKVTETNNKNSKPTHYYAVLQENEEVFKKDKIHIFFLCFALNDINSFNNINNKYLQQMNSIAKKNSVNILVGKKNN